MIEIQEQVQEKWIIFWWALGFGLLMLGIAWRQGFFQVFQSNLLPIIRGVDVLRGFGYFLFIELLFIPALTVLVFFLGGTEFDQMIQLNPQTKGWINLFMMSGGFVGVLFAYLELTPLQRKQLWQQTSTPWYVHLEIGFAAWFISYPLVLAFSEGLSLVIWHFFHHSSIEQMAVQNMRHTMENPFLFILTSLTVVTFIPLTEEFLFRGLLQSWLKHKFHHTTVAIIVSSLVFSLFHYSSHQGITNIELLSSLFLLSCMLGYLYERQHSLWAPIGLHSFFNLMSLLMLSKEP